MHNVCHIARPPWSSRRQLDIHLPLGRDRMVLGNRSIYASVDAMNGILIQIYL